MLSSRWTLFVKYVFGPFWIVLFGVVALGFGAAPKETFNTANGAPPPPGIEWIFIAVWILGSAGILRFTLPLKRVELRDGRLFVSNYFREWEVFAADIVEVRQNRWVNGRPIRVRLRHEVEGLGSRFTFLPRTRPIFRFWREDPQVGALRAFAETVYVVPDRRVS
jgi:hypothetical protein